MTQHVMETVTFRLTEGASPDAFLDAAKAASDYAEGRPGFVWRRLSKGEDGIWIDQIEWDSIDHAQAAAAGIGEAPGIGPFMAAIDISTVSMSHTEIALSLN